MLGDLGRWESVQIESEARKGDVGVSWELFWGKKIKFMSILEWISLFNKGIGHEGMRRKELGRKSQSKVKVRFGGV